MSQALSAPVASAPSKSSEGRFFEDFSLGDTLAHPTPRTLTDGDAALYTALTGSRYALFCADPFAHAIGLARAPIDPLLAFHIVFGKSVPDISLNAVANLGYAEGLFRKPVYAGDTLRAQSEVIGLKENSSGETGVVYVHTRGLDQHGQTALEFRRWVMVNKRDATAPPPVATVPDLPQAVPADRLTLPNGLTFAKYDFQQAGARHVFGDYAIGERIDHRDGMAVEEAEHQLATRLYQNTARVHFDAHAQTGSRFGRRLIYGGVAISTARALAFNGLANAGWMLGINGGRHVAPLFAGDTIYAWSEVLDKAELTPSIGALRLRLVALKNRPADGFPYKTADGGYEEGVILDFDYWAALPRG